jgi:hypothetical protein
MRLNAADRDLRRGPVWLDDCPAGCGQGLADHCGIQPGRIEGRTGPWPGCRVGPQSGGVIVQDSATGDFGGLDADLGVLTHRDLLSANMDAYRRLMNAGLNIACHGVQSYLPHSNDPEAADEIEALALRNGVTFTGCGIWDMSRIWSVYEMGPLRSTARRWPRRPS